MTKNSKKIASLAFFLVLILSFCLYFTLFQDSINSQKNSSNLANNDQWAGEEYPEFENLGKAKAKKFIISTSDKRASKAGLKILQKGGNAIDAVIAAQMVLNVVEPQSSGIGGGAFLLYHDAKTKKNIYFNGRETAPINAHENMFLENDQAKSFHDAVKGGLSVGTPGLLKMLKQTHEEYGKIAWKELFSDAIKIADEGFIMDKKIHTIAKDLAYLKDFDEFSKIYLKENGQPKNIGTLIKNPNIAKTLNTIANKGIDPFYEGEIAQNITNKVQNSKINPGYLSLEDLKNYQISKGNLICGTYREHKICSMPIPSSGGITLLQILSILENFDMKKYGSLNVDSIHLISQATHLAYLDRNKYIADIDAVPIKEMLDKSYLKSRSQLINFDSTLKDTTAGEFTTKYSYIVNNNHENPSTTHISVIDEEGNAIAMTSSIEYLFGSALVVDGFILNNQLTDFSFLPEIDGVKVANRVEAKKQPRSSMTPTFVFDKNDNLIMVLGSPGGPRIIQYVAKAIIANIDWNMDVAKAIALPNFVFLNGNLEIEKNTSLENLQPKLQKLGYNVKIKNITSGINAININMKKDLYIGSADFRRNGLAIGE